MYFQHTAKPTEYKFKYFTPDPSVFKSTLLNHGDESGISESKETIKRRKNVHSFLEPDVNEFEEIRNRLNTLSLNTGYKKGPEPPIISPPFRREMKVQPKRISSISSRETLERAHDPVLLSKPRIHSRSSFLSDDKELRHSKRQATLAKNRASETAALNKLNENILTPGQNPELFSRQIKLKDKSERASGKIASTRSSSPKSVKSIDSSGKIHLGLIDSLDLNEKLSDVEKIKERYSNNAFMHSLTLYKLRGHDRCLKHDGTSDHVPRGTRISSPEGSRVSSKMSADSAYAINSVISPRLGERFLASLNSRWQWEPDKSHINNQIEAKNKELHNRTTQVKRKKSVGFNMETKEHVVENNQKDVTQSSPSHEQSIKEIKSILKRSNNEAAQAEKDNMACNTEDDFLVNESYHWKYQLPKIRSPVQSLRARPPISFRRKMYHFGDGVSDEFEQVISKYGNCRQGSWIRDQSFARDSSFTSKV